MITGSQSSQPICVEYSDNFYPMAYENLQIDLTDGILTVTISREKALNALNSQTMSELSHFFGEAAPAMAGIKGIVSPVPVKKLLLQGPISQNFKGLAHNKAKNWRSVVRMFFSS